MKLSLFYKQSIFFATLALFVFIRVDAAVLCSKLFQSKPTTLEKWFSVSTLEPLISKGQAIVYENGYIEIRISGDLPTATISKTSFDEKGTISIQDFKVNLSGKLFFNDPADPNLVTIKDAKDGVLVISSGDPAAELHYRLEQENGSYVRKKIYQKTEAGIVEIQGEKAISFRMPGESGISVELPITGRIIDFKQVDDRQLMVFTSDGYEYTTRILFDKNNKYTGFDTRRSQHKLEFADEVEFLVHQRIIEKGNLL